MANASELSASAASRDDARLSENACANEDERASAPATKPAKPRYVLKPSFVPVTPRANEAKPAGGPQSAYLRAENEDDDGYDPFSDRRSEPPLFEPDPWN